MTRLLFVSILLVSQPLFAGHPWPIYPHVSNPTETGIDLEWGAKLSGGPSIVELGIMEGDYSLEQRTITQTQSPHVRFENLEPGKRYYYRVKHAGLTAQAWFETNPIVGSNVSFTFAAVGDGGSGFEIQDEVATQIRFLRPKFVLHTGDIVYQHGEAKHLKNKFFDPYHSIMNTSPFFLALGNHDYDTREGKDILDAVTLPTNSATKTENFYSFNYGNVKFIALDSMNFLLNGFEGGTQWNWLKDELENSNARWKIIFFHHPPFSSGKHGDEIETRALIPLFLATGVDLVLNGHDHFYERTKIIDGIQYIITGGGGGNTTTPHPNENTAFAIKAYHFTQVDVTPESLTISAIDNTGNRLDRCRLNKGASECVQW